MKQELVYHALARRESRPARVVAVDATVAMKEYAAYIAMLSAAVVLAIITFTYAATMTVRWLDAVSKPAFFAAAQIQDPAANGSAWATSVQPVKFAMLPATEVTAKSNR
jgi:hypothetical protein